MGRVLSIFVAYMGVACLVGREGGKEGGRKGCCLSLFKIFKERGRDRGREGRRMVFYSYPCLVNTPSLLTHVLFLHPAPHIQAMPITIVAKHFGRQYDVSPSLPPSLRLILRSKHPFLTPPSLPPFPSFLPQMLYLHKESDFTGILKEKLAKRTFGRSLLRALRRFQLQKGPGGDGGLMSKQHSYSCYQQGGREDAPFDLLTPREIMTAMTMSSVSEDSQEGGKGGGQGGRYVYPGVEEEGGVDMGREGGEEGQEADKEGKLKRWLKGELQQ
jgi:hypothetical protein